MTARAIILDLPGACFVGGFTCFNDAVMHQTCLVGNNMHAITGNPPRRFLVTPG